MNNSGKKKMSRNQGNENGNKANLSNENSYENLPTSSNMQSSSNAGILYYKYISEEMEREINELEKAIESTKSLNKKQKENIMEMESQKQKMLSEFHEQYRKFLQKTEYESQLEEEVENAAQFLEKLMPLKTEIFNLKTAEIIIRNYIDTKFQANCSELETILRNHEIDVQQLREKIDEFKEVESQWEAYDRLNNEIKSIIPDYSEKLNRLKWSIKNEKAACQQIINEVHLIQTQVKMETLQSWQTLKNNVIKNYGNFGLLKEQFLKLKDQRSDTVFIPDMLEKLQKRLLEKISKQDEIETKITTISQAVEILELENEQMLNWVKSLKDDIKMANDTKETLDNILEQYKRKIYDEQTIQHDLLKTEKLYEEKISQAMAEMKISKQQQELSLMKNDLSKKIEENKLLKQEVDESKKEKNIVKETIMNLKANVHPIEEEVNGLKKKLLSNSKLRQEGDSSVQEFLNSYLAIEYEQNAAYKSVESVLEELFDKISDLQPYVEHLEENLQKSSAESVELEQQIISNEGTLQKLINEAKNYDSSIQTLKQNVYQGKCITQQDLNKKLGILINGVKTEQAAVDKLKEEIAESTKKRPLLAVENKQKSTLDRTTRSRNKPQAVKEIEENIFSSPDSDIYTFK